MIRLLKNNCLVVKDKQVSHYKATIKLKPVKKRPLQPLIFLFHTTPLCSYPDIVLSLVTKQTNYLILQVTLTLQLFLLHVLKTSLPSLVSPMYKTDTRNILTFYQP